MRIKWLDIAIDSLVAEAEYIEQDNPAAAVRTVMTVINAVQMLKRFPSAGRPGRVHGTRELVISGTPYIVPYRVRGDEVELLLVLHAARRWPSAF